MPGEETFDRLERLVDILIGRTRANRLDWTVKKTGHPIMPELYSYSTSTTTSTVTISEAPFSGPRLTIADRRGEVVEEYEPSPHITATRTLDEKLSKLAALLRERNTRVDEFLDQLIRDFGSG